MTKLGRSFFVNPDVVAVSAALLGKYLFTCLPETRARSSRAALTGGMIVETEAYRGTDDRASHARNGRRTKRTETMFANGGTAYVYLCYGVHALFNIVTNVEGIADAVLVRAIEPTHGTDIMLKRRGRDKPDRHVAGSPGTLTQALGIRTAHNGENLLGKRIWIADGGRSVPPSMVVAGPRIGVAYAGSDSLLPWRFRIRNSEWIAVK